MATATVTFVYPRLFSPASHCVISNTTAELDALGCGRYEGTLAQVMELWWMSYTFDVTYDGATVTTLPCVSGAAGAHVDNQDEAAITPHERICISYDSNTSELAPQGPTFVTADADRWDPPEGPHVMFWFRGVRYNTTTSSYALLIGWWIGGGPDGTFATGDERSADGALGTSSANGGTITFLGQTLPSGLKQTSKGNATLTIAANEIYEY